MSKKLIVMIVALECIASLVLIVLFGPMIEPLFEIKGVKDIYFVSETGERMLNDSIVEIDLEETFEYHFRFSIKPDDASDPVVTIISKELDNGDIRIRNDADGFGATVIVDNLQLKMITIIISSNDNPTKIAQLRIAIKDNQNSDIGDLI